MGKISQVKSQDDFPVTIRKLMRLGHGWAVTLPPDWVRSLMPGNVHYLRVAVHPNGYIVIADLAATDVRGPFQTNPPGLDRP